MTGRRMTAFGMVWLAALAILVANPAEARAPSHRLHIPRVKAFHAPRAGRRSGGVRSLTIRRKDGVTLRGYKSASGTTLFGPNGEITRCQSSQLGEIGETVTCR